MADTPSLASGVPSPARDAEPQQPVETAGAADDTAPGDPLVENLRAGRDTPAVPGGGGPTAQTLGDTLKKG